MKPLHKLNYVEKGKLLYQLFPDETQKWIDFLKEVTEQLTKNPEQITVNWNSAFVSYEHWKKLTEVVYMNLATHEEKIRISSRLFAKVLFRGYSGMYCIHYLKTYSLLKKVNREFILAIDMFFGLYPTT